jgi:hypothetical protein
MSLTVEQARKEAEEARGRGEELAHNLIEEFALDLSESQELWFIRQVGVAFINEYAGFWRNK